MLRILSLALVLFCLYSCEEHIEIIIDELPEDQKEFQKMIIAHLAGESSIKTSKGDISIHGRWNSTEKKHSIAYLKEIIEKMGLKPQTHAYSATNENLGVDLLISPLYGRNLHATLPSTTKSDEYVIVGAHYDTGGKNVPGAIDNGSGIAVILSVMRRAKQLENRNKNLMIVFFDQEEEATSAGSIAFAQYLNKTKVNVHSVHSYDMIGWDGDNNREVELEMPSPEIDALYRKHAALLNIPIYSTDITSSDHYSFIKERINAVGISQAYGKGDNSGKKDTPEDKFHLVNFEYVASSSNLAYEVIKDIIND